MPTVITQVDDTERGSTTMGIEGQLMREDSEVGSRIARHLSEGGAGSVAIDLADVDFIDSDAASVLKELESAGGIELIGVEILLQNVVNEVERNEP